MTVTDVHLLRIDNSMLDYVVAWDQIAALHTRPPEPARAPAGSVKKIFEALPLKHVPPANVRALVDRVESVPVRAGETVVNQGEEGDYYYFIDEGRAEVSRQVRLAELEAGAAFGEEALVCRGRRNASVTMLTDGRLLRVSKEDFDRLLQGPLLNWIGGEEARAVVNSGARWLDVRHTREFNHTHLPKAINLPLDELREGMGVLDRKMHYICYCQTGQRSSAAAFLLKQQGYSVSVLKGGLRALPLVRRAT
ncbi:MAG: cyclic nucleotide-binding domain-containing protein [Gammaproteobacteria bacterium]|nr:cyclic nucleotide-binding domain-containing protein [Gammaproteobacteria bacterium]